MGALGALRKRKAGGAAAAKATKATKAGDPPAEAPAGALLDNPQAVDAALAHCAANCAATRGALERVGGPGGGVAGRRLRVPPEVDGHPHRAFRALARAIVFQQLNGKAAGTIFGRVVECVTAPANDARLLSPEGVLGAREDALRGAGLSAAKLKYLRDLAAHFGQGGPLSDAAVLDPARTDAELYDMLLPVKGIGKWTVDMFLLFTVRRPDVLPVGDLAVRRGVQRLHGLKKEPSEAEAMRLCEPWRPYRSAGAVFMYELLDTATPAPPSKKDGDDDEPHVAG